MLVTGQIAKEGKGMRPEIQNIVTNGRSYNRKRWSFSICGTISWKKKTVILACGRSICGNLLPCAMGLSGGVRLTWTRRSKLRSKTNFQFALSFSVEGDAT